MTKQGRLELRHVEHLMDVCGDSHDGLMLLGTMAVVANVIKQRDAAEAALAAGERELVCDLTAFARHHYGCPASATSDDDGPCVCGYDALMARVREKYLTAPLP